MTICVFGSLNLDLILRTPRLPLPGETLMGSDFQRVPGGKGANQAVAVARLGVQTHLVGRVGADEFGQILRRSLRENGVQGEAVAIDPKHHSGLAFITVSNSGENQIVVAPGANAAVDYQDIKRLEPLLKRANALLLQLEIPLESVIAAAKAAKAQNVLVILDPAPVPAQFPQELYRLVDILTPNQVEAEQLVGFPVSTIAAAHQAAALLRDRGIPTPLITLGAQGVVGIHKGKTLTLPALSVDVVDTTAAGDAFNGGLAAAIDQGLDLPEALRWAVAGGAIAVTRLGAQASLGDRAMVEAVLRHWGSYVRT